MIKMIVAMDEKQGIGKNNKIPWHIPEDILHFKNITQYETVIMGTNTFKSMNNKFLSNRINIVLSKKTFSIQDPFQQTMNIFPIEEFNLENHPYAFIIGGAQIYKLFFDKCELFYITHIQGDFNCDVNLDIDFSTLEKIKDSGIKSYGNLKYSFCEYKKTI